MLASHCLFSVSVDTFLIENLKINILLNPVIRVHKSSVRVYLMLYFVAHQLESEFIWPDLAASESPGACPN